MKTLTEKIQEIEAKAQAGLQKANMEQNHAKEQAAAQFSSICAMVAALNVDYDRLEELRDIDEPELWEIEELKELEESANGCDSYDDAQQAIQDDPISVEVRTSWHSVGEEATPDEFNILLCTGGPAVRILGELDEYQQPCRAWLECQDWGIPWTQYFDAEQSTLLEYCQQFYFGG